MEPKLKAQELVDKFYQTTPNEYFVNEPIGIKGRYKSWEQAKQCALIAVDEILSIIWWSYDNDKFFWQDVKQEIENL